MAYGDPAFDDPLSALSLPQNAGPNPGDQVANWISRTQQSQQPSPSFQQPQPPQQPYQPRTQQLGGVRGILQSVMYGAAHSAGIETPDEKQQREQELQQKREWQQSQIQNAAQQIQETAQYHQGLLANQRQALEDKTKGMVQVDDAMSEELGMPAGSWVPGTALLKHRDEKLKRQQQLDLETQRQQGRITIQDMKDRTNLTIQQQRAAQAYDRIAHGGSFTPLVDENGLIIGAWNPKTQEVRTLPQDLEGSRKTALPPTENVRRATAQTVIDSLDEIETLANQNPGAIGPIAGRIEGLGQATIGTTGDKTILHRKVGDIADMLLRARSGAQINEQEYARLSKLVPSITDPLPTFQAKLKDFRREAQSILSGSTGNQPARPRSGGQSGQRAPAPQSGGSSGGFDWSKFPTAGR